MLDLVGPYALYGRPVIEACIAQETGYLDLTGEIPFVREILLDLDADARAAGVKVIQVSGFEALPADLLVRMAAETASERHGEPLVTADLAVSTKMPPGIPRLSDGISGGTFQSVVALTGREDAASVTDSAALIDDPALARRVRSLSPIALAPRPGEDGAVVGPMAPAPFINPAVIHRSEELAARAEGRDAAPLPLPRGDRFRGLARDAAAALGGRGDALCDAVRDARAGTGRAVGAPAGRPRARCDRPGRGFRARRGAHAALALGDGRAGPDGSRQRRAHPPGRGRASGVPVDRHGWSARPGCSSRAPAPRRTPSAA